VANLTNLTFLGIDNKLKTDAGIQNLASLVNLKQFTFQNNTNSAIEAFDARITNLTSLNIFRCPNMDVNILFKYIASLENLQSLSIHHAANIPVSCWEMISHMPIRSLKVGNAGPINSSVIGCFLKLKSLRHLEFSDPTDVNESDWETIEHLTNLTSLSISEKKSRKVSVFSSDHLRSLATLSQLSSLTITGSNRIQSLEVLEKCKKLQYINMSSTGIDNESVKVLSCLSSLSQVLLEETKITNESIQHLSGLKNLKQLNVNGCQGVTYNQQTIKEVIKNRNLLFLSDDPK